LKVSQITPPAIEPISAEALAAHLNLPDDHDDITNGVLSGLISAARGLAEAITRRALMEQTWEYCLKEWPRYDNIILPFGKLKSVASVKYKSSAGVVVTLEADTDYIVETNGDSNGEILTPYGEPWPSESLYHSNPIVIRFVCGWPSQSAVPGAIQAAIKMLCTDMYENRGEAMASNTVENKTAEALLRSWRLWREYE